MKTYKFTESEILELRTALFQYIFNLRAAIKDSPPLGVSIYADSIRKTVDTARSAQMKLDSP